MIKAIERGTKTVTKCAECGCKFSYENEDIKDLLLAVISYIECPQCGKEIILKITR